MHRLIRSQAGDRPGRHLTRGFLMAALVAAGLAVTGSSASAAPVTYDLCATTGTLPLPGAPTDPTVPVWGFGTAVAGSCTGVTPSVPGPQLTLTTGDTLTLVVHNLLPGTRTLVPEVPGLSPTAVSSGTDAQGHPTVQVSFAAAASGTYLYESSGDDGRQTAMGLYGALLVRPAPLQAYGPGTAFNTEAVLVLSAIDPAFNADPDAADLNDYLATYWMINGKSYPQTASIQTPPGQVLLLRYLNAGFDNTSMALLGLHEHVVARDGHLLPQAFDAAAETIPAGGTEDALVTMPATSPPVAAGFALFNRQLHLTNGPTTGPPAPTPTPGGMLTFIHP
jgi:FtsP/CotA-like multicopper oxidase with cupredoxin domain